MVIDSGDTGDTGDTGDSGDSGDGEDADGDGYGAGVDCNDQDSEVWLADSPIGTMDYDTFCTNYCGRTFVGDLDLSSASQKQVDQITCLTEVTGNLSVLSSIQYSLVNLYFW